jgi:transmembrane sensor
MMGPGKAKTRDAQSLSIDWVMRLDRGELSDAERLELEAWLSADSRHRGAFARAQAIWSSVRSIGAQGGPVIAPARAFWLVATRLRLAASIAVLTLVAGGGFAAFNLLSGSESSGIGEVRRIALGDGSTMVLNTASEARVRFDGHERLVVLKKGEASFLVAKHDARPFIVRARDVSVRAVGTSFVVRMQPAAVSVTVDEGVVEVARPQGESLPPEKRRLSASRQLTAAPARPIKMATLNRREVSRQLAWQEGFLIFDGELLLRAVQEVNRYSTVSVKIDDTVLENKPFFGVFRTGDSRAFAYAVATLFNAHVKEESGSLHVTTE